MTLRLYDNTRLSCHKSCGREFYFTHVKHWRTSEIAAPLAFGSSWHSGMDVIWAELAALKGDLQPRAEEILQKAFAAFYKNWLGEGMVDTMSMEADKDKVDALKMRTPSTALEMMGEYIFEREDFIRSCELIAVEQPFVVPLDPSDPDLLYCGRLDKVVRHEGRVKIIEHKTTSLYKKAGFFRAQFLDSFSPNAQIDGYLYAAHQLFADPDFRFRGECYVDGALVHRDVHDGFCFVPVERRIEHLDSWLWETLEEVRRVEVNKHRLEHDEPLIKRLDYLPAFGKNTGNCFSFNTACSYMDLCKAWANPEREWEMEDPPKGYIYRKWSPFDQIPLERIGLTREGTGELGS